MSVIVNLPKKDDVIDNLTSEDTNKALSAKQGKVLNDTITGLTKIVITADGTTPPSDTNALWVY